MLCEKLDSMMVWRGVQRTFSFTLITKLVKSSARLESKIEKHVAVGTIDFWFMVDICSVQLIERYEMWPP